MAETEEIELVIDARAVIGESPLWADHQNALYWMDIKAPALYRTKITTLETTSWPLPADIGGYALTSGGAVVALRSGIFTLDFSSGELAKLCDPPFDPRIHRFNEVDCDPSGRLWLGTMFDPEPHADSVPIEGHLYSFTTAGGLIEQNDLSLLHNGFAWSSRRGILHCAFLRRPYLCL